MERNSMLFPIFAAMMLPSALYADDFDAWVQQLGHRRYLVREAADLKLRKAGIGAIDALAHGIDSKDTEIYQRCKRILTQLISGKIAKSGEILRRLAVEKSTRASRWAQRQLMSCSVAVLDSGDILVTVSDVPANSFLLGAGINANAGLVGSIVDESSTISLDRGASPSSPPSVVHSIRSWFGE